MSQPPEDGSLGESTAPTRVLGKGVVIDEFPRENIEELQRRGIKKVVLTIRRRSNKGTFQALGYGYGGVTVEVEELLKIDDWIAKRCGGGTYGIWVRDINDTTREHVNPFHIHIEGPARAPIDTSTPVATPVPSSGESTMSMQDPRFQEYMRQMANGVFATYPMGAPIPGGIPAEVFAAEQLRKAEVDRAKADADAEAARERAQKLERELSKSEQRITEVRHEFEMKMMAQRLELMQHQQTNQSQKPMQTAEMIAALAPFVPVLVAMVQGSKESSSKAIELQMSGMQTLMNATLQQANKPAPDPLEVLTKIMPLVEQRKQDPAAQVALLDALAQNQLRSVSMMAGLMEQLAAASAGPDAPPMWQQLVQQVMGMLVAMGQGYVADTTPRLPAPPPPPQQRTIQAQQQQPAQPVQRAPRTGALSSLDSVPTDPTPAPIAPAQPLPGAVEILPPHVVAMLPLEFRSPEWQIILRELHMGREVHELGAILARHIAHLEDFAMLPAVLTGYADDPIVTFTELLRPLPAFNASPESRAYCERVVVATAEALVELGRLQDNSAPEEEDEEEEEEEGEDDEGGEETFEDEPEDASEDESDDASETVAVASTKNGVH
jgi:hypothetical protein